MKFTKMMIISAFIVICVGFFSATTYADNANYICQVDMVGTKGGSEVRVMLTHVGGDFTQSWFICKDSRKNEQLAILMTALVSNVAVQAKIDLDDGDLPEIRDVFITGTAP